MAQLGFRRSQGRRVCWPTSLINRNRCLLLILSAVQLSELRSGGMFNACGSFPAGPISKRPRVTRQTCIGRASLPRRSITTFLWTSNPDSRQSSRVHSSQRTDTNLQCLISACSNLLARRDVLSLFDDPHRLRCATPRSLPRSLRRPYDRQRAGNDGAGAEVRR